MGSYTLTVKALLVFLSSLAVIILYVLLRNGTLEVREDDYYRDILLPITWLIIFCVGYGMKIVAKNVIFGFQNLEKDPIKLNSVNYEKLLWGVMLDESDIKETGEGWTILRLPVRDVIFPLALAIVSALMARSFEYSLFSMKPYPLYNEDAVGLGGCHDNKCEIFSNVFFSNMTKQILSQQHGDPKIFVGPFSYAPDPNYILTPKWPPLDAKGIARNFAKNEYTTINMSDVYGGVMNRTCSPTYDDFGLIEQQSNVSGLPTYGSPDEDVKLDRAYDILNDYRTVFLQTVLFYKNEASVRCNYTIEKAKMNVQWQYNASGLTAVNAVKSGPVGISDNSTKWIDNYKDEENRLGLTIVNTLRDQVQGVFQVDRLSKTDKIDMLIGISLAYAQTVLLRSSTKNDILNVRQGQVYITLQQYELRYRLKLFVIIVVASLLCLIVLTGICRAYRAGDGWCQRNRTPWSVWGQFRNGLSQLGKFVEIEN